MTDSKKAYIISGDAYSVIPILKIAYKYCDNGFFTLFYWNCQMKYVVDTCIFNKLIDGELEIDSLPADGVFVASHIQIDEINKTNDEERRAKLFLKFSKMVNDIIPTETFVIGVSRLGEGRLGDGAIYKLVLQRLDDLNTNKANNVMDALIAEIAIKNGYTLLTTDFHLHQVVKELNGNVLYWKT